MNALTVVSTGALFTKDYEDTSLVLKPGESVDYLGHVPGGNVKVRKEGVEYIAHPGCFKELA